MIYFIHTRNHVLTNVEYLEAEFRLLVTKNKVARFQEITLKAKNQKTIFVNGKRWFGKRWFHLKFCFFWFSVFFFIFFGFPRNGVWCFGFRPSKSFTHDMSSNLFGVCTLLKGEPTKLNFDLASLSEDPG